MRKTMTFLFCLLLLLLIGAAAQAEGEKRAVLNISGTVKPAQLLAPGDVSISFTLSNVGDAAATNVRIFARGSEQASIASIPAGGTNSVSMTYSVSASELDAGVIRFTVSHDGASANAASVNYVANVKLTKVVADPKLEFTRQLSGSFVEAGESVTITYRVRNTGNVALNQVRVRDELGDYSVRVDTIEPGESKTFTNRVVITADTVSKASVSYTPATGGSAKTESLSSAAITLARSELRISLTADSEQLRYGESVRLTLMIENTGNVTLRNIRLTDRSLGAFSSESYELAPGSAALCLTRDVPIKSATTFQVTAVAKSETGSDYQAVSAPVMVRTEFDAPSVALSIAAAADTPAISTAGYVTFSVSLTNEGQELYDVRIYEESRGELKVLSVVPGGVTMLRPVYEITKSTSLTFVAEVLQNGNTVVVRTEPVTVTIVENGGSDPIAPRSTADDLPSGNSTKPDSVGAFPIMMIAASALLVFLIVCLAVSSHRTRQARRAKQREEYRRLRDNKSRTARYTPVRSRTKSRGSR